MLVGPKRTWAPDWLQLAEVELRRHVEDMDIVRDTRPESKAENVPRTPAFGVNMRRALTQRDNVLLLWLPRPDSRKIMGAKTLYLPGTHEAIGPTLQYSTFVLSVLGYVSLMIAEGTPLASGPLLGMEDGYPEAETIASLFATCTNGKGQIYTSLSATCGAAAVQWRGPGGMV